MDEELTSAIVYSLFDNVILAFEDYMGWRLGMKFEANFTPTHLKHDSIIDVCYVLFVQ